MSVGVSEWELIGSYASRLSLAPGHCGGSFHTHLPPLTSAAPPPLPTLIIKPHERSIFTLALRLHTPAPKLFFFGNTICARYY